MGELGGDLDFYYVLRRRHVFLDRRFVRVFVLAADARLFPLGDVHLFALAAEELVAQNRDIAEDDLVRPDGGAPLAAVGQEGETPLGVGGAHGALALLDWPKFHLDLVQGLAFELDDPFHLGQRRAAATASQEEPPRQADG